MARTCYLCGREGLLGYTLIGGPNFEGRWRCSNADNCQDRLQAWSDRPEDEDDLKPAEWRKEHGL